MGSIICKNYPILTSKDMSLPREVPEWSFKVKRETNNNSDFLISKGSSSLYIDDNKEDSYEGKVSLQHKTCSVGS